MSSSQPTIASGPTIVARTRQEIALAILVAVGHHRAVQPEQRDVDRQRRGAADRGSRRAGSRRRRATRGPPARPRREVPSTRVKPSRDRAAAGRDHGRGAQGRRRRVVAGRGVEGALERGAIDRQGREGVGLGRERRDEHPHALRKFRTSRFAEPSEPTVGASADDPTAVGERCSSSSSRSEQSAVRLHAAVSPRRILAGQRSASRSSENELSAACSELRSEPGGEAVAVVSVEPARTRAA